MKPQVQTETPLVPHAEFSNVGSAIASSVSFEEAYDLDLTDAMVARLNSGASLKQLETEILTGIQDRQKKLDELKHKMLEQLDIALKITLSEDETMSQHNVGDPRF